MDLCMALWYAKILHFLCQEYAKISRSISAISKIFKNFVCHIYWMDTNFTLIFWIKILVFLTFSIHFWFDIFLFIVFVFWTSILFLVNIKILSHILNTIQSSQNWMWHKFLYFWELLATVIGIRRPLTIRYFFNFNVWRPLLA